MGLANNYRHAQPASKAVAINLAADTTLAEPSRGIYVGGAGDVKVDLYELGTAIVYKAVPVGTTIWVNATKIYSTTNGTTATNLLALN